MKVFTPEDIAELRHALGLNVVQFAAKLGVHRETVYYWERGERHPRYKILVILNKLAEQCKSKVTA